MVSLKNLRKNLRDEELKRLTAIAESLEKINRGAQAQAVIDRLVPEVEQVTALLERSYAGDEHEELRDRVRRISDRLGLD